MGWLIFLAYIAGFIWSAKSFAKMMLESMEREFPRLLADENDYRKESVELFALALLPSIIWPIAWVGVFVWKVLLSRKGIIETDRYKRMKAERELAELRELARKHNLPMPSIDA